MTGLAGTAAIASRRVDFNRGRVTLAATEYQTTEPGTDPPVVLISGWPQSALAWRKVIPHLSQAGRRVFTLECRGFGSSSAPRTGYDIDTVAAEVAECLTDIAPDGSIELVGHDVGSWVSHGIAALFPGRMRSLALIDAAIPGLTPEPTGYPDDSANIRSWHFGLNRLPELPEILMEGHERAFIEWSFRHKSVIPGALEPEALDEYVRLLQDPAHRHAGFEYYREAFSDVGLVRGRARARHRLDVPVLTVGARHGIGDLLEQALRPLCSHLTGVLIDSGHYVPEEQPAELAGHLLAFWSSPTGGH